MRYLSHYCQGRESGLHRGKSAHSLRLTAPAFVGLGQDYSWSMPRISTGMSMSATPRFWRSQTNCSKYDTPEDICSAKTLTGTISTPASM